MPEENDNEPDVSWLIEPPGPGEVHISIGIGSEVELSPSSRAALDSLMDSLSGSEVSGFMFSGGSGGFDLAGGKCPSFCNKLSICSNKENCSLTTCKIGFM